MLRKSKIKKLKINLGLGLMIGLILFFAATNYRIIKRREGNEERLEQLKSEVETLEQRKEYLRDSLDESDDREYIERVLREDFLMKKPGEEKVVILLDENQQEKVIEKEEKSGLRKLFNFLPWID
jgi:cell division protein FtsB